MIPIKKLKWIESGDNHPKTKHFNLNSWIAHTMFGSYIIQENHEKEYEVTFLYNETPTVILNIIDGESCFQTLGLAKLFCQNDLESKINVHTGDAPDVERRNEERILKVSTANITAADGKRLVDTAAIEWMTHPDGAETFVFLDYQHPEDLEETFVLGYGFSDHFLHILTHASCELGINIIMFSPDAEILDQNFPVFDW